MQPSFMCFDVFDYGNPHGLCVECMWTYEGLQFGIQKLRLKHATIPVKNQGSSAGISITLRVGQLRNCASIPGSGTRIFFLARSQNCDKRLLGSSHLSVRTHAATRLPLDEFS